MTNGQVGAASTMWIGIGVGAAVGLAVLINRRKREPWSSAKAISRRVAGRTGDLAAISKDLVERVKVIYNESCKVVDDATDLWARGRKLARV
jgi:hypothetical protein